MQSHRKLTIIYQEIKPNVFEALTALYRKDSDQMNAKTIRGIQNEVKDFLGKKSPIVNARLPKTSTFSQWIDEWCEQNGIKRQKRQGRKKQAV